MAFKIRDLIISSVSLQGGRGNLEDLLLGGICDAGSEVPPGPPPPPPGPDSQVFEFPDTLELRTLLQIALSRLGGPVTEAELQPKTLADLELLEKRLTGALEEVRSLKQAFGD